MVVGLIDMHGSQALGGYFIVFLLFCWTTGCRSASLMLYICNAASPWSQTPFPDSQWSLHKVRKLAFQSSLAESEFTAVSR